MPRQLEYEDIKDYINGSNGNGCTLITTIDEFEIIKNDMKLQKKGISHGMIEILCECKQNIFKTNFNTFKTKNKKQCNRCSHKLKIEYQIRNIKEYIENELKTKFEWINIKDYNNGKDKLVLKDDLNYKYEITYRGLCALNLKNDKFKLFKFGNDNSFTLENMKLTLINDGIAYVILSDNVNTTTEDVKFKCENGHIFDMSWNEFYDGGVRCPECMLLKRSGKNHWKYNAKLTKEERVLKRLYLGENVNKNWRNDVYKLNNYTCQCCGDNKGGNLIAHHLNGYNWFIEGRFAIENGITLCEDCHKTFHKEYGYGDNTKEQFEEFMLRYNIKIIS